MILYLDASAGVKHCVAELGSFEVSSAISRAQVTGTAPLSRVEVKAALAKSVRLQVTHPGGRIGQPSGLPEQLSAIYRSSRLALVTAFQAGCAGDVHDR